MVTHFVMNFVIFKDNKVLLERKPEGKWKVPGGHIEPNETPIEALHREVEEELQISVSFYNEKQWFDNLEKFEYLQTPTASLMHHTDGDSVLPEPHKNIVYVYLVTTNDEPKSMEGQEIKWFDVSELESEHDEVIEIARRIILKSLGKL